MKSCVSKRKSDTACQGTYPLPMAPEIPIPNQQMYASPNFESQGDCLEKDSVPYYTWLLN